VGWGATRVCTEAAEDNGKAAWEESASFRVGATNGRRVIIGETNRIENDEINRIRVLLEEGKVSDSRIESLSLSALSSNVTYEGSL
jgi:hypothetical protein